MIPGLTQERVTLNRYPQTTGTEGDSVQGTPASVGIRGLFSSPSPNDIDLAAQRGEQIDVTFSTGHLDVQVADELVRGDEPYTVVAAFKLRASRTRQWVRAHLRRVV